MSRRRSTWGLCLLGLSLAVGCGVAPAVPDSGPDDADAADVGATDAGSTDAAPDAGERHAVTDYEGFLAALAALECRDLIACGIATESASRDCSAALVSTYEGRTRSIALGAARFSPDRANRCLEEILAHPPDCLRRARRHFGPSCTSVIEPLATTGEACDVNGDCVLGSDVCDGVGCDRRCTPYGGVGAPCLEADRDFFSPRDGSICADGLYCDREGRCQEPSPLDGACFVDSECVPGAVCAAGRCVAAPPLGAPCTSEGRCGLGLWCDGSVSPPVCRTAHALGAACVGSAECGVDGYCPAGVCVPRLERGETCPRDTEGCRYPLSCSFEGHCEPRSTTEGTPCVDARDCAAGLACDVVLRTCRTYRYVAPGESCTGHTVKCAGTDSTLSGVRCMGLVEATDTTPGRQGICTEFAVGDACPEDTTACPTGSACIGGACTASVVGTPCTNSRSCSSLEYCGLVPPPPGEVGSLSCVPRIPAGAPCTDSESCVLGLSCTGGVCAAPRAVGDACPDRRCPLPMLCLEGTCQVAGLRGSPCVGGMCANAACNAGVCEGDVPLGGACVFDDACGDNRCVDGVCIAACG